MAIEIAKRNAFLGGSDIAAALGLSKYKTMLQLWAEKTGQIEAEDITKKLQVRLGNKLEPTVAELFEEETGKKLHRVNEPLVHKKFDFLRGQIDRRVVGEKAIVEIKTNSPYRLHEYADEEMPIDYLLQTVFYMALSRAEVGYLAVLFGNTDFRIKVLRKDEELEADIIKKAVHFWQKFVIPKVMPSVSRDDADTLYSLFPVGTEDDPVALTDQANILVESRAGLIADKKICEGQIDKIENELKVMLGKKATGVTDRYKISWANQKQVRLDTDAIKSNHPQVAKACIKVLEFRKFGVTKIKEAK